MKSGVIFCLPLFVAIIVGCVISPRRIVSNTAFPSPSPTISASPTPTISVTPTPTPAGIMSIIFTASPGDTALAAIRIHQDGSKSPVPAAPFLLAEAPRQLLAVGANLLIQGENSISVYAVDNAGSLRQTDLLPLSFLRDALIHQSDSTLYALDESAVSGFRLENGRLLAIPGSHYPIARAEGRELFPEAIALDDTGGFIYVKSASAGKNGPSFIAIKRNPDGSLESQLLSDSITEEAERAFANPAPRSAHDRRMTAVVFPEQ